MSLSTVLGLSTFFISTDWSDFSVCKFILSQIVARNDLGNSLGQGPFPKGSLDMAILFQWAGGFHLVIVSCAVPCSLKARPQFLAHFIFLHKHNHCYQRKRFESIVLWSTNSSFLLSRVDTAFFLCWVKFKTPVNGKIFIRSNAISQT